VYVFGPEDGSLDRAVLGLCHRFVVIPTVLASVLVRALRTIR
jgi:tRNA C32,U32 (ribose-2'-O)-methylase TrmJ